MARVEGSAFSVVPKIYALVQSSDEVVMGEPYLLS